MFKTIRWQGSMMMGTLQSTFDTLPSDPVIRTRTSLLLIRTVLEPTSELVHLLEALRRGVPVHFRQPAEAPVGNRLIPNPTPLTRRVRGAAQVAAPHPALRTICLAVSPREISQWYLPMVAGHLTLAQLMPLQGASIEA